MEASPRHPISIDFRLVLHSLFHVIINSAEYIKLNLSEDLSKAIGVRSQRAVAQIVRVSGLFRYELRMQNGERAMKKRGWLKDPVSKISVLVKNGRMKVGKGIRGYRAFLRGQ